MNPYANLMMPNYGQAFTDAYNQGAQMKAQQQTQNALMRYAENPNDPEVFSEMAKANPQLAIQLRGQQQQQQQHALEAHRDNILKGAQIVRQLGVKDEAGWQQALAMAQQVGIDLADVPPNYDPQYVQRLVAVADAFDPQRQNHGTALQQNFEFLQGQDPALAQSYLRNQAEGAPLIASNGDGTFTIIPRSMAGGQQASAPPPPPPGFVIDGGPTPPASGAFPIGPL